MKMEPEDAKTKYADIIDLPRPEDPEIFRKHPRMPVSERAKIFSPFAALRGYDEQLSAEDEKLLRQVRIDFSEEEAAKLSGKLAEITKGMEVTVTYFLPEQPGSDYGSYTRLHGRVAFVDPACQVLRIDDTVIAFKDLAAIILPSES